MAAMRSSCAFFFVVLLASCFSRTEASGLETGDAMALALGIMIVVFGTCACLGAYARRRNGFQ